MNHLCWKRVSAVLAACLAVLFLPWGNLGTEAAENTEASPAVYDLVLFFGQSNMVGNAIGKDMPFTVTEENIASLSEETGIDEDILAGTASASACAVNIQDGTAYEYQLVSDELVPVTGAFLTGEYGTDKNGSYVGTTYDRTAQKFVHCYITENGLSGNLAASASLSTNMVSAFCARWYERTGHGVIVVFDAVGGTSIQDFLPSSQDDEQSACISACIDTQVKDALEAALRANLPVSGAYYVCCQGESDLDNTSYVSSFREVTDRLYAMGFQKGAIAQTSYEIGTADAADKVKRMHLWQEMLDLTDDNLVTGSSLDYDHYIPDEETYDGADISWKQMWGGLSYGEAYRRASLLTDTVYSNRIHLNSSALAQMGRECADALAEEAGLAVQTASDSQEIAVGDAAANKKSESY